MHLIDGEIPMDYRAVAAHPVWAECSPVLVLDSC